MKKLCIFLILVALLAVSSGCVPNEEDTYKDLGEPEIPDIDVDYSRYFQDIDSFKSYINDKEKQSKHCPIDDGVYVDFSSILPDSEIEEIAARYHNWYDVRYSVKNDSIFYGLSIAFVTTPTREKYDYNVEEMIKSGALNETPIKSISELKDYKATTAYTWVEIGEYTLFYPYNTNYDFREPDNGHKFDNFSVFINDYQITIQWNHKLSADDYTPEQSEFLSALVPDYGATNDSVIEMLNKIKALIPTGDEANGAQINASADASFELDSTNPIDTPSSDDSGNSEQTVGETVSDTDIGINEEEEYLYPEDYEFPVIPGISPDWKPNRNGKYPYKDGYTKYELTLILACEILIDFGDLTDEEISKLEFRCIEED
ncbi:MAG: hypothetical protein E7633_00360 [Ruminococcaceae bacterium]|nr:hypothetical protein [Oscillospiraceae bacterium]